MFYKSNFSMRPPLEISARIILASSYHRRPYEQMRALQGCHWIEIRAASNRCPWMCGKSPNLPQAQAGEPETLANAQLEADMRTHCGVCVHMRVRARRHVQVCRQHYRSKKQTRGYSVLIDHESFKLVGFLQRRMILPRQGGATEHLLQGSRKHRARQGGQPYSRHTVVMVMGAIAYVHTGFLFSCVCTS
jgi:hypothetical protein